MCIVYLNFKGSTLGDMGAKALGGLNEAAHFHTLILVLLNQSIGDIGAQALAGLKEARTAPPNVGSRTKQCGRCWCTLAGLKDSPTLHTLTLSLADNNVGDIGARALAALKESPTLHTLTMSLTNNNMGDIGAQALVGLKEAPALHRLMLDLARNNVGEISAQAFAGLKDSPPLHSLILSPRYNNVGEIGAQALPLYTPTFPSSISLGGTEVPTPAKKWIAALCPYSTHPGVHWVTWLPLRARRRQVRLQWLWGNVRWQGCSPPWENTKINCELLP